MEVHHHAHTARRKWTHYFWEFLMLFLAVFCGFLAEYQLEHKIEKERGMQYIRSFYEDLKTDTAEYAFLISMNEKKIDELEKKGACYDSLPSQVISPNPCIAALMNNASGFIDLLIADQTLLQLKNAGGFRLLKKADTDSILAYDRRVRHYIKTETTGFQESQYRMREIMSQMINYKSLRSDKQVPSVPFLSADGATINRFFVMLEDYYRACKIMYNLLKRLNKHAIGLLDYFKKKYNLN